MVWYVWTLGSSFWKSLSYALRAFLALQTKRWFYWSPSDSSEATGQRTLPNVTASSLLGLLSAALWFVLLGLLCLSFSRSLWEPGHPELVRHLFGGALTSTFLLRFGTRNLRKWSSSAGKPRLPASSRIWCPACPWPRRRKLYCHWVSCCCSLHQCLLLVRLFHVFCFFSLPLFCSVPSFVLVRFLHCFCRFSNFSPVIRVK